LAAASNRSLNSISLFGVRADGSVEWLRQREVTTGLDYSYGLCMFRQGEQLQVFINDKDGRYQQWAVAVDAPARLLREFRVHDQPEGCEVDDAEQRLFLGIEDRGVYVMDADASGNASPTAIARVDGGNLVEDVEGMSLYWQPTGGYLVVSSQGSNNFAVYDRMPPHALRGVLAVAENPALGIDGVSDTDGVVAISAALGGRFPQGLLVLQDGHNSLPEAHQNFKLVDWRAVATALQLD
jgi:3-phytase